ncbi:unnamed protein product, partial [Hydatigera taeniaeformis]|uniref:SH3_10 domain-containing protein n=1 Tax=Hydatigena taeniaeformis TaxID=6205 RepID=A0A0R3WLA7_HYDTA
MNVGVNFRALDEERQRQEHLLRELQEMEAELTSPTLTKTNLPYLASQVGAELDQNTRCLHYLTGISELERYVTDVAAHCAERSIELSDPQALHKNVFISKTLSDNVKSCWEYVDKLAMLAQIHIKTAAEYHQFFHESNEVEAKLEKHLRQAQRRQHATTGREGNLKDFSKTANELSEQLESMRSLWNRCIALLKRSESVVPMRLRLGGVRKSQVTLDVASGQSGPILVRALISLTGPNYRIQQGEVLPLVDNQKDTHLWKVQTSSGVVEVPSVCFWVTGHDAEATQRAIVLKQQCKKTWLEIIRLFRQRLYHEYTEILPQLTAENVTCTKAELVGDLVTDIHNHLITHLDENGRLRSVVENFQRCITNSRRNVFDNLEGTSVEGHVLRESDLIRLRSPLLRLEDHLMAVGLMQEDMKRLNEYLENYLSEVRTEQNRISKMVEKLVTIATESQAQLADLVNHLGKFGDNPSDESQSARAQLESAYRSRSQPFDLEVKKNFKGGGCGKRTRSQTVHLLDAMVQIGTESKSAETQCRDTTSVIDPPPREPKNTLVQPNTRKPPVQRCVITQIGPSNKETCTQVDISDSSYSEECYVAEDMKGIVKRSTKELISDRRRKARSASRPPKRPPVVQVNTCTQLGLMTHERSVSPIHALLELCPNCQTNEFLEVQKEYEETFSLTQRCQPVAYGSIQSEMYGNHVCKRVQCGYPCLNDRSNLYCQVDVLGPLVDDAIVQSQALRCNGEIGTIEELFEVDQEAFCETRFVPSGCHLVCKRVQTGVPKMCDLADSFSQTLRTCARPICDHMTSATQIGIMTRERECSPVHFGDFDSSVPFRRKYIQAQVRQPKFRSREPTVTAEALRMTDWSSTDEALQMTHCENLYIEPTIRHLHEMNCSGSFFDSSALQHANINSSNPELDRISKKGVFSVNSHGELRPRDACFGTCQGRHKMMLRAATTAETEYPIVSRASPSLCHIASSIYPIIHPVDRRTARLQTKSLPNLLEGVSQIETQSSNLSLEEIESIQGNYNATANRTCYNTLQTIPSPRTLRNTACIQSSSLPSVIDSEFHIEHAVSSGELQTLDSIPSERFSNDKLIGSCSAKSQHKQYIHRQFGIADGYCNVSRRSVSRSFAETHASEVPVRQYSAQACKKGPEVAIAEISQHASHMSDVGIAEVQIHPFVHQENKKVQVREHAIKSVHRICVETPAVVRYDVTCDAMIKPSRMSKKAQVEIPEEPILAIPVKEPNVYAEPPMPKTTSNMAIQMSEIMKVVTAQLASQMENKKVQCEPSLSCAVVSCQQNPQTSNKKLQVSVQMSTDMRLGGAETTPILKTTYGKKLQVDLAAELLTRQTQTIPDSEPEPILMSTPLLQYSAPPTASEDFSCDAPRPVDVLSKSIQSDPISVPQTLEKMLQVKINESLEKSACQSWVRGIDSFTQFEPKALVVGTSQSIWEEPEPILLHPPTPTPLVMAAPPLSGVDDGCDPIHALTTESASQAEKMKTWGKKLQVTPESYSIATMNTCYDVPVKHSISTQAGPISTAGKDVQIKPVPLALVKSQSSWVEPPSIVLQQELTPVYSAPPKKTQDFSSDAPLMPQMIGKKLQVTPQPLAANVSQTTYFEPKPAPLAIDSSQSIWTEPEHVIIKAPTPEPMVMAAPPPPTSEFSCNPCPPETQGKKLQVIPEPLAISSSQTGLKEILITITQRVQEPIQLSLGKCESLYEERKMPEYKNGLAQCKNIEIKGKKLQVSPQPLAANTAQTMYVESKPTPMAVGTSQALWTEPPPITL